jgi:hypothetical protein
MNIVYNQYNVFPVYILEHSFSMTLVIYEYVSFSPMNGAINFHSFSSFTKILF